MTEPSAKVLADSISPLGDRLTTLEVVCHRFVLAEFNTHRMFSRNSASSRAIPLRRQLEKVRKDPAIPLSWPAEQQGMQGGEELTGEDRQRAIEVWLHARNGACYMAERMGKELGVHKSIVNRLLEPFMWHTIIVSATEWDNFFRQRCSPLAQPEIRAAADAMAEAIDNHQPSMVGYGEWHMPMITEEDREECLRLSLDPRHISVARCCRVSYLTHDGKRDLAEDQRLYERLCNPGDGPPHASPLEHVATPTESKVYVGNFHGWDQLRHEVLGF